MSTFFIVTTTGARVVRSPSFADLTYGEPAAQSTGCVWLFSATADVNDAEDALRAAVIDFFESSEGRRARDGEEMVRISWREAIPWVSDEIWGRHGLTVFRHPEVERIVLDEDEDLAEEFAPTPRASSTHGAIAPMPSAL